MKTNTLRALSAALAMIGCASDEPGMGAPPPPPAPVQAGEDPCMGVPEEGRCTADGQVEFCNVPSDTDEDETAATEVLRAPCDMGERCGTDEGFAQCVPVGECRDGDTSCADGMTLRRCAMGRWQTEACTTSCDDTGVGAAACAPSGMAAARRTLRVTLEAHEPNADRTDWAEATVTREGVGFTVSVFRGMERVDVGRTGDGGRVELDVPSGDDVRVVVSALQGDGDNVALALGDPGSGAMRLTPGFTPMNPRVWSWEFRAGDVRDDTLHITERMGSGAANLYNVLHKAWREVRRRYPTRRPLSLIGWAGDGTTYTCGACFNTRPIDVFDASFRSQTWLPMGGTDHQEWADSVTGHEAGHWVMSSFGRSPGEGGSHSIGVPTMPGQAWSEGFATWFSFDVLRWNAYVDKQNGAMFFADIANRRYRRQTWSRPSPEAAGGLLQRHDENDVSAILRTLAGDDSAPIYAALASPRMRTAPFARRYFRHTWERGLRNLRRTTTSAPCLADQIDALNCASFSRATIDRATDPDEFYPYPSATPLCAAGSMSQHVEAPVQISWVPLVDTGAGVSALAPASREELVRVAARVEFNASVDVPVEVSVQVPTGVTLREGRARFVVPALRPGLVVEERYAFTRAAASTPAVRLVVHAAAEHFGLHGAVSLSGDEAPEPLVRADGARVRLGRHDLGGSVRAH